MKLLDSEVEDSKHKALRESWWQEIRHEIRTHAMSLGCNLVVGYSEETSIFEEIVVLSANGTAVQAKLNWMLDQEYLGVFGPPYLPASRSRAQSNIGQNSEDTALNNECSLLHIGDTYLPLPFNWSKNNKCKNCLQGREFYSMH